MEFQVLKINGSKASKIKVDDSVFGIEPNASVVHQAVLAELSNRRQGTHSAKSRGMVRGGGRKPWRQKGRGAARAGTIRSPLWVGGGTVFGPQPHTHKKRLPKKMKTLARKSVLADKAANGAIFVVDELKFDVPKTKQISRILEDLNLTGKKVTVLVAVIDKNLFLSIRNLPNVRLIKAERASAYDILDNDVLLFDKAGLALLNKQLR